MLLIVSKIEREGEIPISNEILEPLIYLCKITIRKDNNITIEEYINSYN